MSDQETTLTPAIPCAMAEGDIIWCAGKFYRVEVGGELGGVKAFRLVELPSLPWWERAWAYIEDKWAEWRYDL